jgi:mannosyltransferase OCH1-like enzyme
VTAFAGWEEQDRYVCNALMGCTPGHPFFGAVLDELPGRYRARRGEPMNIQTGPRLITDMHTEISGLTVFDQPLIYPYGYTEMNREWDDHPEAYTSHHWGHTRGRWSEERI